MSFSYDFSKVVAIPDALNKYILDNASFVSVYSSLTTNSEIGTVTVYTTAELTGDEPTELSTLIANYTDPAVFLTLDHTDSFAMHSHYTADTDNIMVDGEYVMQTWIFKNPGNTDTTALDAIKTVVEFTCANPAAFYASTGGDAVGHCSLEIMDVSRNLSITTQTIELAEIATRWNTLGANGQTTSDTVWRSTTFYGLMNKSPTYDCIWQARGSVSDPATFDYRINGLQYLFYNVQRS